MHCIQMCPHKCFIRPESGQPNSTGLNRKCGEISSPQTAFGRYSLSLPFDLAGSFTRSGAVAPAGGDMFHYCDGDGILLVFDLHIRIPLARHISPIVRMSVQSIWTISVLVVPSPPQLLTVSSSMQPTAAAVETNYFSSKPPCPPLSFVVLVERNARERVSGKETFIWHKCIFGIYLFGKRGSSRSLIIVAAWSVEWTF